MSINKDPFILALPKGRVFKDFLPKLENTPFALKDNFENSRKMLLDTRHPDLKILIIRGWDVPAYITSGAAHLGVVGKDILIEKEDEEFVELLDLEIGKCRLSLAGKSNLNSTSSRLRVATKYPNLTTNFMFERGVTQFKIVKSLGATEIYPFTGSSEIITDITSTGETLRANNLRVLKDGVILKSQACLMISQKSQKKRGIFNIINKLNKNV